jgi:hypothetical protein
MGQKLRLPINILAAFLLAVACFASETESAESAQMLSKYLDATEVQQDNLRGVQMDVDIEASLPKLEKHGKLHALRTISRLGRIIYKPLGFSGDSTVKNQVITRYLSADSEARGLGSIAITSSNYKSYKFKYRGRTERDGRAVAVFQVTPRKKLVGLFKGELWLDAATAMPVRESGLFVKSPSIFLKKIQFVRDYEIRDGMAFPKHIESTVDTRLAGRAELSVNFSNFVKEENAEDDALLTGDGGQ